MHASIFIPALLLTLIVGFLIGYWFDNVNTRNRVRRADSEVDEANRRAKDASHRADEVSKQLVEMKTKIQRGEIFAKFDLSTASHMGEFVDAFRVVRVSTKAKWAGNPAQPRRYDSYNETEVIGFTESEHLARTYVERWDNVHSDFKQGYEVEALRVFKLPNGDYLKALPFAKLPVLKPRDFSKERQVRERTAGDEA